MKHFSPQYAQVTNGRNKYELTTSGCDRINRRNTLFRSVDRIVCRISITNCNDRNVILF